MGPMVDGLSDCAKGVNTGRWAAAREFGPGGRRRRGWCARIGCCGGCGRGEGAALRGLMVDGVKRERLREARRTSTPDDERWRGSASSSAEACGRK